MSQPLRVLLIEDSEEDAAHILRQLRQGGYTPQWRRVETAEALAAALDAQAWDVLLSDYGIPSLDVPEALRIVRERRGLDMPFIVISGAIGEERAAECVRMGARDFILRDGLKDRPTRLPHAIERELAEGRLRSEKARKSELERAEQTLPRSEKLRVLGQLASGLAHDMKNVLAPLSIRVHILTQQLKRESVQAAQENVAELQKIIRAGIQTIDRIRGFSRQAPDVPSEIVDVNELVPQALALLRPRLTADAGTRYEIRTDLGSPTLPLPLLQIRGSSGELTAALVNLISNSIDAMPGGGTITLRTRAEGNGALIQVIDDGPGMTPEVERRLFEPFFTTKGEAGTGLGLAMVYGTIRRHAGTISLTTAPGKGATFSLWFPSLPQTPSDG